MSTALHSFIDIFESQVEDSIKLTKIEIPIIQRDYAQGRQDPEVERVRDRFLNALHEAVVLQPITLDFVYGDIDENGVMTPLDGQQRLTTLFLLHWYAAKRDNIEKTEYEFLRNFSYETRYSARYFCKCLIDFEPNFEGDISAEIINQPWFPLDWKKDPTISSMLVMLDAIHEHFKDVPDLWTKLKAGAITFYFLPIKDMGLTDELYIKMNSRGKPLTLFEHFKAELEKEIKEVDKDAARRIISKFDKEWLDLFWKYRDGKKGTADDNTTDDEFLNYFAFICDVICYQQGDSPQNYSHDEFDLIQRYFSVKCENAIQNINTLEKYFDCWCDLPNNITPAEFLNSFMSAEHETDKIKVDSRYRDKLDILEDCVHTYSEFTGRQRRFPLNRFIMMFAIICYLQHKDDISDADFRRRIRIINNLLQNSEDDVADRADRNRVPAALAETEYIMINGNFDESIENHFNVGQTQEEIAKIAFLESHADQKESLFKLEDHSLLHGQIGIIGLDNLDLTDRFYSLFECSLDKIDCALMSVGDYGQMERNKWRYQYGSSRRSAWNDLFHRSSNAGFEKTSKYLVELLRKHESFDNDKLDIIAEEYIAECEAGSKFTPRYYYIKYHSFRPGSFGKMAMMPNTYMPYRFSVMQTKSFISENTYDPYLKEADPDHIDKDSRGQRLTYLDTHIIARNNAFIVRNNQDDAVVDTIEIIQDENGIDTEDRIIKLRNYIEQANFA